MKQLTVFILLLCLYSCDYFDKKKVNTQDIVNEELQTFNWNDVDEYPSFKTCESLSSKQESKQCFETTLITHITNKLSDEIIVVTENVEDTVVIKFHISETGNLSVLNIKNKETTKEQIPNLDSLLHKSLDSLPRIFPAIKRGQQVKTEFTLPIVIQMN
jgi:putative sterol carrier protein